MIIVFGEAKPPRQEVCRAERIEAKTDDYASVAVAVGIDINKAQIIPSLRIPRYEFRNGGFIMVIIYTKALCFSILQRLLCV